MERKWVLVGLLVFVVAGASMGAPPQRYWPSWRGPNATGSTQVGEYPSEWSGGKNTLWKIPLPGKGCSTPAVYGDQIIVATPLEKSDAIFGIGFDGKVKWRTKVGRGKDGKHRNGSSTNSSPVTDGKYIFAYFKSGNVAGLDMKGKLLWKTNLQERYGKDTLYWDIGTSPVITKKYVVIAVMHKGESYLVAFDKATGKVGWKVARNYECPVEGDHSYATPILIKHKGREALVVWGAERLTAHDAADGKIIWSCSGFNPQKKNFWVAVASAVIVDGIAVVPYGRGKHLTGVKLGGSGDVTKSHRLWTLDRIGTFVPSPVGYQKKLYCVADRGAVTCLDPKTGKTLWKGQLPRHRASYYASPVIANGKLYATREDGMIFVADIRNGFKLLAENNLGERMIASPVPVDNHLLLRGEQHLYCIKQSK